MHIGKEGSYIWCASNPYCIKTGLPAQPWSFPCFLQCTANPYAQRAHVQNTFGEIPHKSVSLDFDFNPSLSTYQVCQFYGEICLLSLHPQYSTSEREREREERGRGGCIDPSFFSPVSQGLRSRTGERGRGGGYGQLLLSGLWCCCEGRSCILERWRYLF